MSTNETVLNQLRAVFRASGLTMSELATRSGIERTKLLRRFSGERGFQVDDDVSELDDVAEAMGARVMVVPAGYRLVPSRTRGAKRAA